VNQIFTFALNEHRKKKQYMRKFFILALSIPLVCAGVVLPSSLELQSPDGQIVFSFGLTTGYPSYSVSYKGKMLVEDSRLSLNFEETGEFGRNLSIAKPEYRTIDETYELVVGKTKTARNFCHEAVIPLVERGTPSRRVNLVVRAFNDGVAFRYEFPEQKKWKSFSLTDECTTFKLSDNPMVRVLFLPHFRTWPEGFNGLLRFSAGRGFLCRNLF
jgi:alpha-glucosidase